MKLRAWELEEYLQVVLLTLDILTTRGADALHVKSGAC